jgi:hypothetical protein
VLKPEERFSGFLEELFRFRLALREQEQRVREAGEAARKARAQLLARGEELLFSPGPQEEVLAEMNRLRGQDRPHVWRLKNEAQFLLGAIRGVYLMSRALERIATGQPQAAVRKAIDAFHEAVPDRMLLRNIHEHLDQYLAGKGRQSGEFPTPEVSGIGVTDEGLVYVFGGKVFHLGYITRAAEALGDAVAAAVRPPRPGVASNPLR